MQKERRGIVLDKWDEGKIEGHMLYTQVGINLDYNSNIKVTHKAHEDHFELDTVSGFLEVNTDKFLVATEIAFELRRIGFDNILLFFGDKCYDASGRELETEDLD